MKVSRLRCSFDPDMSVCIHVFFSFKLKSRIAFDILVTLLSLNPVPQFTTDIEVKFIIQDSYISLIVEYDQAFLSFIHIVQTLVEFSLQRVDLSLKNS